MPGSRLSAEWGDALWVEGRPPRELDGAGELAPILERSLDGIAPTKPEVESLFRARGERWTPSPGWRTSCGRRTNGDRVTYVVNRNINYTNLCYFRCGFCAFSKGPRSLNLRGEPYLMGVEEIVQRAREAWDRGATEVCLQGGIHPDFTGDFYSDVVESIKAELPDMHIHGFTPLEVWQGAETLGVPVRQFLTRLRDAGLGTLPGTAAEVLDDRVRHHLCPDKVRTAEWAEVMITAHELGLRATSTLMFGHIDGPSSWAEHYEVLRAIQRRTGGFTEFVPLPFVHMGAPIFLRGRSRPGPTWDEVVLVHAVARIAFDGLIPNIQASWVKLGLDGGARLLDAGCNDLGGTLMNEIITRSAGAAHGQEVTPSDFEETILAANRVPARRSTTYEILERSELAWNAREHAVPEAVIVATARTAIGRAFKGSLNEVRPDDMAGFIIGRAHGEGAGGGPGIGRRRDGGVRPHPPRAGRQPGPQDRRAARRAPRHRARDHRQPLLRLVAAERSAWPSTPSRWVRATPTWQAASSRPAAAMRKGIDAEDLNPRFLDPERDDFVNQVYIPMGITAENVAEQYGVSRERHGRIRQTVPEPGGRGPEERLLRSGDHPVPLSGRDGGRPRTRAPPRHHRGAPGRARAGLQARTARSPPATRCPLNDGAAAVLVMERGQGPFTRARRPSPASSPPSVSALAPEIMGVGPVEAVPQGARSGRA